MKPKALATLKLVDNRTPEEKHRDRMKALGPIAERFGLYPKGTVLPETQVIACPKRKVADFPAGWIPQYLFDNVEQDQKLASCCRHPENHEIEARKSHPDEQAPDIYVLYCTCGRKHRRLIGAKFDRPEGRPYWE
jgi:hypothetical protein